MEFFRRLLRLKESKSERVADEGDTRSLTCEEVITCPQCTSNDVAPIVHGVPTDRLIPLFRDGKIIAGGAMGRLLSGKAPNWQCLHCEYTWRGGMFTGGPGDSLERAVIIRGITSSPVGIRLEKHYLTEQFGLEQEVAAPLPGWMLEQQMLLSSGERFFDLLTIVLPDGTSRGVYFDITSFYGKKARV
jgi:hypothetical protein